jgi:hypothetical protein
VIVWFPAAVDRQDLERVRAGLQRGDEFRRDRHAEHRGRHDDVEGLVDEDLVRDDVDRLVGEAGRGPGDRVPVDPEQIPGAHVDGDVGTGGDRVREPRLALDRLAVDRLAGELVGALREPGQEILERDLVERRLGALEEELGEAELLVRALALHGEDHLSVRVPDVEALPVLAVEGDLDAEVDVGRVVFPADLGDLEPHLAAGTGRDVRGDESERGSRERRTRER